MDFVDSVERHSVSKRNSGESGMGMVGVLMALGLLGALSAGTMAVIQQVLSVQARQKFRDGVDSLSAEVRSNLADQTACRSSFQGTTLDNATNAPFNAVKNAGNVDFVTVGASAADNSARVTDIRLDTYDAVAGTVLLKLTFQAQAASVTGGSTLSRTIRLQARKDAANALTDCVAMSKMSDGIWQIKPGTDDIFFVGGKVGAQTNSPATALDINGEVKFGNTNVACAPTIEGSQRYNSGAKQMEFCNGTTWTPIRLPASPTPTPAPAPVPTNGTFFLAATGVSIAGFPLCGHPRGGSGGIFPSLPSGANFSGLPCSPLGSMCGGTALLGQLFVCR